MGLKKFTADDVNWTEDDKKAAENYDEYNAAAGLLDTYQKALIEKRDMIPLLKSNIYMESTKENEISKYIQKHSIV